MAIRERVRVIGPLGGALLVPQLRRLPAELVVPSSRPTPVEAGIAFASRGTFAPIRSVALGARHGLRYQGVAVFRVIGSGGTWEVASLRLAGRDDEETPVALLNTAAAAIAERGGRMILCRAVAWDGAERLLRRAGFAVYAREVCFAVRASQSGGPRAAFRVARGADLHDVFRLYCRLVPEHVRRQEATTFEEFRALRASWGVERDFISGEPGDLRGWVGIGRRGVRVLCQPGPLTDDALALAERVAPASATLIVPEHAEHLLGFVSARGYPVTDSHLVANRRLARMLPLPEAASAAASASYTITR